MDRKDLLIEEALKEKERRLLENTESVEQKILEGGALQSMMETFGWKILYTKYIKPNIDDARFLGAHREDLADVRAEIRALKELMSFIETRVNSAKSLAEKIKK